MIEFIVEGLPTSYNKHFQIIWAMKMCQLSPEAHAYKNRVKMSIPPVSQVSETPLAIHIEYHYDFYYKNKRLKKVDTANCDKILLDAIAERLGIDDSYFKERHVVDKHDDKDCFTKVRIDILP